MATASRPALTVRREDAAVTAVAAVSWAELARDTGALAVWIRARGPRLPARP